MDRRDPRPLSARPRSAPRAATRVLIALAVVSAGATGCKKPIEAPVQEKSRPVRVVEAKVSQRPVELRYVGSVSSKSIKQVAFQSGGRIARVYVDEGDRVRPGQKLARLDATDYQSAVEASRLQLRQAEDAFAEATRVFEKVQALVADGARPESELDQARLQKDVREASAEQARLDLAYKERTAADTSLRSDVDGFVVDVMKKPGEIVGAGYPVVLLRTERQVVTVGVTQADLRRLQLSTPARVEIDDVEGQGQVAAIAQIPDQTTRTYTVDVELVGDMAKRRFFLGSLARVFFQVGDESATWVPVPAVITEGSDFVYVVVDGRALRKTVQVGSLSGSEVQLGGLAPGDQVIVEGMKNLKDGYKVEVQP